MEGFEETLPAEQVIENGLGILIREKSLYHGSNIDEIKQLAAAEETTVGNGVYFTSAKEVAADYGKRRAKHRGEGMPIVYRANIENLKFIDLRKKENIARILPGFLEILHKEQNDGNLSWNMKEVIRRTIATIQKGSVHGGNLREVAFHTGTWFTSYLTSLGYDGLITLEGGEGDDVGAHDTYLIFDPKKIMSLEKERNLDAPENRQAGSNPLP